MTHLTAGKLAKVTDINIETVRYYERVGILPAPQRLASGYRIYDEQAIQRLRFVTRAKSLGFSLEEIKGLLSLYEHSSTDCEVICERARLKCADIEKRIIDLKRIHKTLKKLEQSCPGGMKGLDECTITKCLNAGDCC